jgi:hypothetical protein
MSTLLEEIEDLENEIEECSTLINGATATLSDPPLTDVASLLGAIETVLDGILDPNNGSFPHLNPTSAGSATTLPASSSPAVWANRYEHSIDGALAELLNPVPNHNTVGDKLRTMLANLGQFRDACGI